MDAENTLDHQIAPEIERLRSQFTDTQELYREVCVVLFFRHGITPTANRLYQLVRKGSMSAPAEALRAFWEDLREKSRIRIEHPDLPEALKTAAGELVATLWMEAQGAAYTNLADLRQQAAESIGLAQAAQLAAEKGKLSAQEHLEQLRHQFQTAQERSLQLERELSAERTGKESLSDQLILAGQQHKSLESALNEARREFASELEKQRQALERSEERLQGSEKRALLEIDRERQAANRLQHEIQQLRQTHQEEIDRHKGEIADFQKKSGEFNQKLGVAEGMLLSQKETTLKVTSQLATLRDQIGEKDTQIALLNRAQEISIRRISALETELASKPLPKTQAESKVRRRKNAFF